MTCVQSIFEDSCVMTKKSRTRWILAGLFAVLFSLAPDDSAGGELLELLKDEHARGVDLWIYNDLEKAKAQARRTGKPIFVTFRCVPCEACKAFDAEVARNNQRIKTLANKHFVSLRQVEMKGVDLSQFQFDYDLNWAAMFINADGVVYGRYGTQSERGPDAYNSIRSLEKAMYRVLALHRDYPENKAELAGKLGQPKPYKTALEMPGLSNREQLAGPTTRSNCIHCHNIHDAQQEHLLRTGRFTHDDLWRYPLPENIGLEIDPRDGQIVLGVKTGSSAERAGIRVGDVVTHSNGQPVISIADIQWVLHGLPNLDTTVQLTVRRDGDPKVVTLGLKKGWKRSDISWRGSMWSLKPVPGFWAQDVDLTQVENLGLEKGDTAYKVRWINTGRPEGRSAKRAGLREGDFIVGMEERPLRITSTQFHAHVRLNYKVGDMLPLTLLRNGKRLEFRLPLVE